MNAPRHRAFAAKFAFHEVVVVEFFFGKIQAAGIGFFRPAGLVIGTAFRTGFGVGWNVRAAIRTSLSQGSFHPSIFLVRLEAQTHEHIIMLNGLHVLNVIFQTQQVTEAEHSKHLNGGLLLANEFGLDSFESQMAGDSSDLTY